MEGERERNVVKEKFQNLVNIIKLKKATQTLFVEWQNKKNRLFVTKNGPSLKNARKKQTSFMTVPLSVSRIFTQGKDRNVSI